MAGILKELGSLIFRVRVEKDPAKAALQEVKAEAQQTAQAVGSMGSSAEKAVGPIKGIKQELRGVSDAIIGIPYKIAAITAALFGAFTAGKRLREELIEAGKAVDEIKAKGAELDVILSRLGGRRGMTDEQRELAEAIDSIRDKYGDVIKSAQEQNAELDAEIRKRQIIASLIIAAAQGPSEAARGQFDAIRAAEIERAKNEKRIQDATKAAQEEIDAERDRRADARAKKETDATKDLLKFVDDWRARGQKQMMKDIIEQESLRERLQREAQERLRQQRETIGGGQNVGATLQSISNILSDIYQEV